MAHSEAAHGYREMDGNFRTTMVPRDWVPDAWDTPDY